MPRSSHFYACFSMLEPKYVMGYCLSQLCEKAPELVRPPPQVTERLALDTFAPHASPRPGMRESPQYANFTVFPVVGSDWALKGCKKKEVLINMVQAHQQPPPRHVLIGQKPQSAAVSSFVPKSPATSAGLTLWIYLGLEEIFGGRSTPILVLIAKNDGLTIALVKMSAS